MTKSYITVHASLVISQEMEISVRSGKKLIVHLFPQTGGRKNSNKVFLLTLYFVYMNKMCLCYSPLLPAPVAITARIPG